jgi:hypothetical protein
LVELPFRDEEAVGVMVQGIALDTGGDLHEVVGNVFGYRHESVKDIDDIGLVPFEGDLDFREL